jgi:integrase
MQAKQHVKLPSSKGEKRAVTLVRGPNAAYRKREHLTPAEVAKLINAAKCNRYGQRDATMVLVCDLEWSAIDFTGAEMHVSRKKPGKPATHPIRGDELRELRKLRKESTGSFVFVSERGAPFTPASFNWMIKRAGQKAGLPFQVHAHTLRHSAGYKLAGDGHDTRSIEDYLGHQDIRHTVRYTALPPSRSGISGATDRAKPNPPIRS